MAMRVRLLGGLELIASTGHPVRTATRKASLLLAALAVVGDKGMRREALSELFWPDRAEPQAKGSLRQAIAAIRQLAAGEAEASVKLDSNADTVRLIAPPASIDIHEFDRLTQSQDAKDLVQAAELYRGDLLTDFAIAEPLDRWFAPYQRDYRRKALLLCEQLSRLAAENVAAPCESLAQRLLAADPAAEEAHRALIRRCQRQGKTNAALRQFELCKEALRQVLGTEPEAETRELIAGSNMARVREFKGPSVVAPASVAPPPPMARPEIHYCRTADGVRIAYALVGRGPPLVKMANWLTHIEHTFASPLGRHLREELYKENTLVFYDPRANGLSDWNVEDLSLDAFVRDLEAVADAARLERSALFGISQGATFAAAYAAKHPDRVSGLILCNGWARGWRKRLDPDEIERRKALSALILHGWGQTNSAYRQMFSSLLIPDGNPEQMYWLAELERVSTSPENAYRLHEAFSEFDVTNLLHKITAPTLVLHARHEVMAPFSEGQAFASGIPGSRFVPLESRNHLPLPDEPAWHVFQMELRNFLRQIRALAGSPVLG